MECAEIGLTIAVTIIVLLLSNLALKMLKPRSRPAGRRYKIEEDESILQRLKNGVHELSAWIFDSTPEDPPEKDEIRVILGYCRCFGSYSQQEPEIMYKKILSDAVNFLTKHYNNVKLIVDKVAYFDEQSSKPDNDQGKLDGTIGVVILKWMEVDTGDANHVQSFRSHVKTLQEKLEVKKFKFYDARPYEVINRK